MKKVSVIGAGTMGMGIAQIAATHGHSVCLYDNFQNATEIAQNKIEKILLRLIEKNKITSNQKNEILRRINFSNKLSDINESDFVIEAIIENMDLKKRVFSEVEKEVGDDCLITSNTSSLSVAEMSKALEKPGRFAGLHFFNPVNKMPLVEIITHDNVDKETGLAKFLECNGINSLFILLSIFVIIDEPLMSK